MGFFQRGLLIYLCLAIAVTFTMPSVVFNGNTPASNTVLSWFNLQYNPTTNTVTAINTNLNTNTVGNATNTFTTPTSPASTGSLLGFLDPVYQVFSWIPLIFKVLGSPIILMTSPSLVGGDATMAYGLLMIIGIPLMFLMIVGLIIWIRSGFP